jgi:trehalose 2-sulfotransferase
MLGLSFTKRGLSHIPTGKLDKAPMTPISEAARPQRAYIVCATPRSGSTLLCEMLTATGVAGRPGEHVEFLRAAGRPAEPREYFAGVTDRSVLELLPVSAPPHPHHAPIAERVAHVLRDATTPNGVFGTKVMWGYMADLQERLAELPELARLDDAQRLAQLLGDVRYVHVSRPDHLAQAISLWRAVQTRAWRAETDDACEPVYSFAAIDHLRRLLEEHDCAWNRWFGHHELVPLRLTYDEIAADPRAALRRTLDHLGVSADAPDEPPLRRQAGEQSQQWAERYTSELAARA